MQSTFSYWLFRITSALRWYAGAGTRYDVHSPHLVEFLREVYNDDRHYHAFDLINSVRAYWRRKSGTVKLRALGAPSKTTRKNERTVSSLVATNAIDDQCGRFLFRLAIWLEAQNILEFGTNAGISTLYLHAADTRARLDTVEGNPDVAALAQETFTKAGSGPGLQAHVSLFQDWLDRQRQTSAASKAVSPLRGRGEEANERSKQRRASGARMSSRQPITNRESLVPLDLFFLDGDHREQPTLDYVNQLLPRTTENSVFVIADIHWSPGMERAWEALKQLPEVTASVDVYHFGLLFFKPGVNKVHISLIRTRFKPWRIGFFN
ncbi:O-methyltransferase [Neolewinella persica]|uniref:O-methyltransferase n=1 Tax=Neolewinella persica TaxID=70998 RepID=UPI00037DCC7B|nr:class I SAM-dependent methyltransferase [Neolewinella persica]